MQAFVASRLRDAGHLAGIDHQPRVAVAPAGPVHAGRSDSLNGSVTTQTLVLGAPEELTRLVAHRIGEFEGTRQPTHFAKPVCEIPFRFRPPAIPGLLTAHPSESPLDAVIEDLRHELVRRVAAAGREANSDVYDALEDE